MPVLLYRLIRLEAGADYRAIVRRPLFRPVWLSAHSFWNFFLLSEKKKPWRRHPVWNESPCSTFICEKLYSAYNSSHQRKAEKWAAILNGTMACEGMWLNVPIYCLCCQLGHKQFVPVFIWVFWRGECCVCVQTSFVCFFPHMNFLVHLDRCCSCESMHAGAWERFWLTCEGGRCYLCLSLLGVTVQIAPCQALSSNSSLLPQLDPHHSDTSLWGRR